LPLLIALGVLFCWHVYLVLHNKTTIEVNQSFQPWQSFEFQSGSAKKDGEGKQEGRKRDYVSGWGTGARIAFAIIW
jgi:hypothetical protein